MELSLTRRCSISLTIQNSTRDSTHEEMAPLGEAGAIRDGISPSSDNIIRTHKHHPGNKRELPFGATIGDGQH